MNKLIIAFILGLIEGITEFLPISSTGHMILFSNILNFTSSEVKTLQILVQLGAVLTLIIVFRNRLISIMKTFFNKDVHYKYNKKKLCLLHVILGTIPASVFGFYFYNKIKIIFEPKIVMYSLIIGSILLLIGELFKPKQPFILNVNDLTFLQVFFVGCFQCFALFPGFSRSGATITCGLLIGASRCVALELSYILGIPIMLGSIILELYKNLMFFVCQNYLMFIIGFITSFIIGRLIINFIFYNINKISLIPFVIYRFILASAIFLYIN